VLVAVLIAAVFFWNSHESMPFLSASRTDPSVAVLPFVNMSNEPDNDPFADGLSEEVLNVLAGIKGLKVAGRTSSFYFKDKNEKPDVIAATLGVNHLLEGSVRWAGPKVRITAQLIKVSDGFHLWSQSFDRDSNDIFAVQEEIARAVAAALQVQLLPADEAHLAKRGTGDAEAHQLYLTARGRLRQRDLASVRAAKTLFEDALERDASYANAYSGLADAYYLLVSNHAQELERGEQLGEQAANRAVELDPNSSEAYASRANFAFLRYSLHGEVGQVERAMADFRRAIELDPSNAQAHHWYGNALAMTDAGGELAQYERAVELDPLLHPARLAMATLLTYYGQFDKARAQIKQVIAQYPDYPTSYYSLGWLEWTVGRLNEARSHFQKAYALSTDPSIALYAAALSYELDDRATGAEWAGKVTGNAYFDGNRQGGWLSLERKYPEALEIFTNLLVQGIEDEWLVHMTANLALLANRPEQAAATVLKRFPELASPDVRVIFANNQAATLLAASWQRTGQRADADRLLGRVARWLDGPDAPRWPQNEIARAEVLALLGERDQAFAALDRAFEAGHRGALTRVFVAFPIRSEDNPLFENIRADRRFAQWHARLHADNARQLASLKSGAAAAASN
jgi:TolB-like protein